MNILVIGNGFDLAHGLPTKYTDFLEFCRIVKRIYSVYNGENEIFEDIWKQLNIRNADEKVMKETFRSIFLCRKINIFNLPREPINYIVSINTLYDELYKCIYKNFWIDYFEDKSMFQKEGWIDFESEISRIIQSIDNDMKTDEENENMIISRLTNMYLAEKFLDDSFEKEKEVEEKIKIEIAKMEKKEERKWHLDRKIEYLKKFMDHHPIRFSENSITYKELIKKLEDDLNRLIRALEIYLAEYVESFKCNKLLPDIQKYHFDGILSFNYTDTYARLYGLSHISEYDYIHGKAELSHTAKTNNMVLGIDEYLSDERKNKDVDFIGFKKYYQRIYKETGCEYKKWISQIQKKNDRYLEDKDYYEKMRRDARQSGNFIEESKWRMEMEKLDKRNEINNLYIFGHSLDVTDKDILRDLILNDNVYTTIYYHKTYDENGKDDNGRSDLGSKIANLVKIIGQDELIKRTGGSTKTIEFKLQQEI